MAQGQQEGGGEVSYDIDYEKVWKNLAFMAAIFAGLVSLLLCLTIGDVRELKAEAIKRGFATWVSDEAGRTTFTWKEPTP